jgi:drug/metabolite transporter (DMT)-like permease
MALHKITWQGILIRFLVALGLVFSTYNPHGLSYFGWVQSYLNPKDEINASLPLLLLAGIVLLIVWTIYVRATMRSLGMFGLILAAAFFGVLLWLAIDFIPSLADNMEIIIDLVLVVFAGILATGITWSHMRRRITGQTDVDDVDA